MLEHCSNLSDCTPRHQSHVLVLLRNRLAKRRVTFHWGGPAVRPSTLCNALSTRLTHATPQHLRSARMLRLATEGHVSARQATRAAEKAFMPLACRFVACITRHGGCPSPPSAATLEWSSTCSLSKLGGALGSSVLARPRDPFSHRGYASLYLHAAGLHPAVCALALLVETPSVASQQVPDPSLYSPAAAWQTASYGCLCPAHAWS